MSLPVLALSAPFPPKRAMSDWLGIASLIALVLVNGFFVAAEFALVSVRRTRVDQLAEEGHACLLYTSPSPRD